MQYNKVEICGVNTSGLKTLTDEEKQTLLLQMRAGDKRARTALIDGNLRLVLSIVQRFSGRGENMDDLFQVGCIGLMKAVDHFNVDLEVKFSTYAVPMIIGEIRRYLRDNNTIRVSRSMRDLAYRALQIREGLSRPEGREPSVAEIAAEFARRGEEYSPEEIIEALEAIVEPISLYEPIYSDGGASDALFVMDQIRDPDSSDDIWVEDIALRQALAKLPAREKKIIEMRFFSGKTQMEIAEEIGISQAQVSRLEKGALAHIRKQL